MKFESLLLLTFLSSRAVLSAPAGSEEIKILSSEDKSEKTDEHSEDSAELKVLAIEQNNKNKASGSDEIKHSPSEVKLNEMSTDKHKEVANIMTVESANQNTKLKASSVERVDKEETQNSKESAEVKHIDEERKEKAINVDNTKIKEHLDNAESVENNNLVKTISSKEASNKLNPLSNDSNMVNISVAKANDVDNTKTKEHLDNAESVESNNLVKTISSKEASNKLNPLSNDSNMVNISVAKANDVDNTKIKEHLDNAESVESNNLVKTIPSKEASNKLNPLSNDSNMVNISVAKDSNKEIDTELKNNPVSMLAIPEISNNLKLIQEAKNDIQLSLRKIKESKKEIHPVSQAIDKTKPESNVSTSSKFFRPIELIKEFAILTGAFVNSFLQVPIALLAKLKNMIAQ